MNHYASAFNRHPNPARGCVESVNWNLKGADISDEKAVAIVGCGPKALAIAAKAEVLRKLKKANVKITVNWLRAPYSAMRSDRG